AARRPQERLAAAPAGPRLALSRAVHVRLLLPHRDHRLRHRLQARPRESEAADLAPLAALPLPPAHVRRAPQVAQDGRLRHPRGMGKARAEGDGGGARSSARAGNGGGAPGGRGGDTASPARVLQQMGVLSAVSARVRDFRAAAGYAPLPWGIDLLLTDACNLRCTYARS